MQVEDSAQLQLDLERSLDVVIAWHGPPPCLTDRASLLLKVRQRKQALSLS
jgi:hypothetical protein